MIVADTDILIDALAGRQPARDRVGAALAGGRLATTTINAFELWSGASRAGDQNTAIETLLTALEILPLDEPAARTAAGVRHELEGNGQPIGMADYLIAGICLSRSLPLLTGNRRHFGRVGDLELLD